MVQFFDIAESECQGELVLKFARGTVGDIEEMQVIGFGVVRATLNDIGSDGNGAVPYLRG